MDANLYNGLALAYMGDAIYEIYVRKYALSLGYTKVNELHKKVTCYTNALAQANAIHYYLEQNILTETELSIFKRGRNSHIHTKRKNVDLANYLDATGFEALLGYLYLKNDKLRLEELIEISLKMN
ncbi:MAG: ribonuclease III [Anaeroplasmataceae bacterium]|nr:ribonuclease III [Anaeroplasmataceae bacterium]